MRRIKVLFTKVSHGLSRSNLPDLDYALNPYIGCLHGCIYCYARLYTKQGEASSNWGKVVVVKENLLKVLREEVRKYRSGVVGLSTITDPYQPIEAIYRLTRGSLKILLKNGFHVSIQTKNTLVLRDLDLLIKYHNKVDVGFTITTLNTHIAKIIEPYSSPPYSRAKALKKIADKNIETWIFYGPVIPGLNDDLGTIREILNLAVETNSKVLIDNLHVKPFMKKPEHPLREYIVKLNRKWWGKFVEEVMKKCREYNIECIKGYAEPSKITTLDKYLRE